MSDDASCDVEQKAQAVAAGQWLVHLCQKGGALGRELTPLEEKKFNEFFELYDDDETFKHYHIQAVHHSLSGKDYRLAQALLAKDKTKRLLQDDPFALQIAIKAVRIEPNCLHESVKESAPRLLDTVKLLIEHGAVVNSLDEDGNSALFYTCVLGYAELFKLLCESGADFSTTHQRRIPEQLRRLKGDDSEANDAAPDDVNLLQTTLDALISPQRITDFSWIGYPPGMNYDYHIWKLDLEATWGGIVLELMRKGLTCAPDDLGLVKLLHVSCNQGALDFVTPLLEFGASINVPDCRLIAETGREQGACNGTALHAAAANWQISTAQLLLQHGADTQTTSACRSYNASQDLTPVGLALTRVNGNDEDKICTALEFCEMMMQAKTSLDEKDYLKVLNFCAQRGRLDFLRQLLQRGVRPSNMPDTSSLDVVLLLLEHGVKIDPRDLQRKAVERSRLAILRWSVSQHGGLLPSDPEGWGAIIFRVARRRPLATEMLEFLTSEYPGPHVDSVLQIRRDGKSDSTLEKTNLLQIVLGVERVEAVKVALDAGADPRCPGLPEDALTAFQRMIRGSNMIVRPDDSLQIIRLLQDKMLYGTLWTPPSVTETRAKSEEVIDTQKRMWDARIERLVQSRSDWHKLHAPTRTFTII
ncbi:heterokaryon incompatibility protein [Apiospora aurea]|uniref:Heterokaryon incompatibility protein n=1 Tax=Apiospora aurea TaxID=335848 RepID=A0ABR1Q334_9PEZI